uniref:Ribosome biogenesis protein SLX9 n=1 Tax=Compsopogon caeruleus TaxID=31354 RepID=A0A7S1TD32_9RHOD|mmetsp:Transcript_18201/g.37951  ORF Transcript_18201/g.37951 Transcript_18201/m.37951 type:complete len:211 (+) Transcript_18201:1218-1850(+)|eukprot:CAMPEP_0184678938 /NCGR_PEP_ID=MMETSP0312-20130426/1755_1 /TAXON_ID=31354 /ORGANISM="Compsopogon coeruleus, Strain SAG 36.94" /LENGTH=210 /DNA_ID=CAMNT_0027128057 /DNA_START=1172 /DNA_END=1804 /DNA_ORIENTATION=-
MAPPPSSPSLSRRGPRKHLERKTQKSHKRRALLEHDLGLRTVEEGGDEIQPRRVHAGSRLSLDEVRHALQEAELHHVATGSVKKRRGGPRAKKHILAVEKAHLDMVMKHPTFQANPLQALQEHLTNTVAPRDLVTALPPVPALRQAHSARREMNEDQPLPRTSTYPIVSTRKRDDRTQQRTKRVDSKSETRIRKPITRGGKIGIKRAKLL